MRHASIVAVSLFCLFSVGAAIAIEKLPPLHKYKCYAYMEDENYAVIDVEVEENSLHSASAAAAAEGHQYPDEEWRSVVQILECVSRNDEFADANARYLDERKLR